MHRLPHLLAASNFGKTCGIPKSPTLAGGYGGAKGFSEIGGRMVPLVDTVLLACQRFPADLAMVGVTDPIERQEHSIVPPTLVAPMPLMGEMV